MQITHYKIRQKRLALNHVHCMTIVIGIEYKLHYISVCRRIALGLFKCFYMMLMMFLYCSSLSRVYYYRPKGNVWRVSRTIKTFKAFRKYDTTTSAFISALFGDFGNS